MRKSVIVERKSMGLKPTPGLTGFTLVELLVVISIIALLVSILLPSLSKAREQAKQVMCMSNQRQLAIAFQVYAGDNEGRLPGHGSAGINAGSTFYLRSGGYWDSSGTYGYGWTGLGLLYGTGVFDDMNVYFCPSQKSDSFFSYTTGWDLENRPEPWKSGYGNYQWGSYMYRVFNQYTTTDPITSDYIDYIKNVSYSGLRGRTAMTCDIIFRSYRLESMETWAHKSGSPSVNVGYSDSSVSKVEVGEARYENSWDWYNTNDLVKIDTYAAVFFKCLDEENFRPLDDAYDNLIN